MLKKSDWAWIIGLTFLVNICKKGDEPTKTPTKSRHQILIEQVDREEKALQQWKDEQAKKAIIRAMRDL